jgi:hypothetical protein
MTVCLSLCLYACVRPLSSGCSTTLRADHSSSMPTLTNTDYNVALSGLLNGDYHVLLVTLYYTHSLVAFRSEAMRWSDLVQVPSGDGLGIQCGRIAACGVASRVTVSQPSCLWLFSRCFIRLLVRLTPRPGVIPCETQHPLTLNGCASTCFETSIAWPKIARLDSDFCQHRSTCNTGNCTELVPWIGCTIPCPYLSAA